MPYKFILEPYKGMNSRYTCAGCGKRKTFTRYIDTQTGNHLGEEVGKCNREVNCSYHYTPKQYFEANKPVSIKPNKNEHISPVLSKSLIKPKIQTDFQPVSFIPVTVFKESLKHHSENSFIQFLIKQFGFVVTNQLISRYFIGTSKHWEGATVFWQIDNKGWIRTGKIMLYNPNTGKRSKELYHKPNWVHCVLKLPEFNLQQCFFGEHLLKGNTKPVAICESEKTALIASVYIPEFLWLACGSLNGLNAEKCKALKGQKIILYPDLKAFDKWQAKAKEFSHLASFTISDLLERKATESEKQQGLDLADYLLRFPVQAFDPEPLHLYSNNISMLGETHTGMDFNNIIIAGIKTNESKVYDLLFNESGELIQPGEQDEAVSRLASFFEKTFQPAFFDNTPCWVHTDYRILKLYK